MAHPFEKMFDKALKTSTELDNQVLKTAEAIKAKGYSGQEIALVLEKLERALIDPKEAEIVGEALEEFRTFLPDTED